MNKGLKVLLILVALVCFGVALSYPIMYEMETRSNTQTMDRLAELRKAGLQRAAQATAQPETAEPEPERQEISVTNEETLNAEAEAAPGNGTAPLTREANNGQSSAAPENPAPTVDNGRETSGTPDDGEPSDGGPGDGGPGESQSAGAQPMTVQGETQSTSIAGVPQGTSQGETTQPAQAVDQSAQGTQGTQESRESAASESAVPETATPTPSPTPDRSIRSGALPYPMKEKVTLDESLILPQYRELYELNHDFVGWITIQGTDIDYPVVQNEVNDYYLRRDFFGEENKNGQIILDALCDPYTPSYNLIISGHNMRNESMFSTLVNYFRYKEDWNKHKFVQFDSLMEERMYVVIAAFFAVDYAVYDDGFRYNADIQYKVDADLWLAEVRANQLYNTGIDAEFGDEFLTLTTCNSQRRKNGRFVVICRRLREGETIE